MKTNYEPLSKEELHSIKAGDVVERMLAFKIPVYLSVKSVTDTIIDCGRTFNRDTGLEIDEDIPSVVSYISKILTDEQKEIVKEHGKL